MQVGDLSFHQDQMASQRLRSMFMVKRLHLACVPVIPLDDHGKPVVPYDASGQPLIHLASDGMTPLTEEEYQYSVQWNDYYNRLYSAAASQIRPEDIDLPPNVESPPPQPPAPPEPAPPPPAETEKPKAESDPALKAKTKKMIEMQLRFSRKNLRAPNQPMATTETKTQSDETTVSVENTPLSSQSSDFSENMDKAESSNEPAEPPVCSEPIKGVSSDDATKTLLPETKTVDVESEKKSHALEAQEQKGNTAQTENQETEDTAAKPSADSPQNRGEEEEEKVAKIEQVQMRGVEDPKNLSEKSSEIDLTEMIKKSKTTAGDAGAPKMRDEELEHDRSQMREKRAGISRDRSERRSRDRKRSGSRLRRSPSRSPFRGSYRRSRSRELRRRSRSRSRTPPSGFFGRYRSRSRDRRYQSSYYDRRSYRRFRAADAEDRYSYRRRRSTSRTRLSRHERLAESFVNFQKKLFALGFLWYGAL
ncbi:unnamed protein product [Gongylonema pulchrum]|uniref:PHD-type domain-containing protein n=1 Tax=Gongylonema pulchrum TaxID=637853 RepID=A0A183EDQ3_9BILA|nr:unnamed protein product [Gongylonema pulchrum]